MLIYPHVYVNLRPSTPSQRSSGATCLSVGNTFNPMHTTTKLATSYVISCTIAPVRSREPAKVGLCYKDKIEQVR